MQLYRRIIKIILLFLISFSCQNNNKDNHIVDVLILRGPSAMSMLFMIDEMDELDGHQIKYEILDEPLQIRARLLREEPEVAMIPTNMAANLYNKGVPYQLAGVSVWGTLELIGRDTSICSWNDLKGKRVHLMAKGMTPDILFRFLACENNLDPDNDLILDYSFPTHSDLANAVIAGLSDIAVLSEPLISMVHKKNVEIRTLFNLEQEWKKVFNDDFAIPQTSLVVKSSFARENPELVVAFLEKYQQSCSKIVSDLSRAGQLAVSYNILHDTTIARESIPGCNLKVLPSWEVKDKVKAYLGVFYKFNPESIGGRLPDEAFFFEK